MQIEPTALDGVLILTPRRFGDARGWFSEVWNARALADAGVVTDFVQDNHSYSRDAGTVRGLHYQSPPHAQAKLVRCGRGRIFDVAVDIRAGSPAYGKWIGVELSAENGRQLLIPAGFLHGFVTREDATEILYKCTAHYDRAADGAVAWDSLGIGWGVSDPVLSDKDRAAPRFSGWTSPFVWEG